MTSFGPFEIVPDRIVGLKAAFTPFVNRLLELEVRVGGIPAHLLEITSNDTTRDGGVDAALRQARGTDYLPAGDSAWQFKQSNIGPQKCANEFEKATWAHQFVREGGCYVMVIGASLTDKLVEDRRKKIVGKAIELGLIVADDRARIRVYDANHLARWASGFTPLAVSRLIGGPGVGATDYEAWQHAGGRVHGKHWIADSSREDAIAAIRSQLASNGIIDLRIQGDSGIGKTRLVLEALGGADLRTLVVYVPDERAVSGEMLTHLIEEGRLAILVVDECPAERHIKLVERIPAEPTIKLVTIGGSGAAASRSPVIAVGPMPEEKREEFLKANYPLLSSEARRFISDHSQGNMRWTIVLADRVSGLTTAQAADIIAIDDIRTFITTILPEGGDFFCAAVLALVERIGWDRDVHQQLETLASFAGVSVEQMEAVGLALEGQGLLTRQGRYRAIGPHPFAVFLAAEAWRNHSERIVNDLLPRLDSGMALSLFRRAADLGAFEPARSVLSVLLSGGGPFESLELIEASGLGAILTQLAIVLPDEVVLHMGELIEATSLETLQSYRGSRRDLVWTLEKLVWHRRTFSSAADSLLRLALAENETYGNNATGIWVELFGAMLPATAASPDERLAYLSRVVGDPRPDVRLLTAKALAQTLVVHETVPVSGELQRGVLVEPRGKPATWGEVARYRQSALGLLESLLSDDVPEVAAKAENILISAVHSLLDDPLVCEFLTDLLSRLTGKALQRLRTELGHLLGVYERNERHDKPIVERLDALLLRLPKPTDVEELRVLAHRNRWDTSDGQLQIGINRAIASLVRDEAIQATHELLQEKELPAAWELGQAFAETFGEEEQVLRTVVTAFDLNSASLLGYLTGLVKAGNESAFDDFLTSDVADSLDARTRAVIAARGPVTASAKERILASLYELPVIEAANVIFGWRQNLSDDENDRVIENWLGRVVSQQDYNAFVDWMSLTMHGQTELRGRLREYLHVLVMLRKSYPDVSNQSWGWAQLAGLLLDDFAPEIARLLLDLVDEDSLMLHEGSEESRLLTQCACSHPHAVWVDVADRIDRGSWKIQLEIRSWLLSAIPAEVLEEWTAQNVERARLIASIAPVGGDEPTPVAIFLLRDFGSDTDVRSSLYGSFVSGVWWGNESDRIAGQIGQLNGWRRRSDLPLGVRTWAREMIQNLEAQRRAAKEREAERRF